MPASPYRARAPHPHAFTCACGWRHPVRFHPTISYRGPSVKVLHIHVVFTCPDCGLEHVCTVQEEP